MKLNKACPERLFFNIEILFDLVSQPWFRAHRAPDGDRLSGIPHSGLAFGPSNPADAPSVNTGGYLPCLEARRGFSMHKPHLGLNLSSRSGSDSIRM